MMVNSISFLGSFCELFWLSSTVTLGSHSCRKFNAGSFVVLNNFSKLQALLVFLVFRSFRFSFFDVIALGLYTMEANSLHAFHVTIWLSTTLRKILHKTTIVSLHFMSKASSLSVLNSFNLVWFLLWIRSLLYESLRVYLKLEMNLRPLSSSTRRD